MQLDLTKTFYEQDQEAFLRFFDTYADGIYAKAYLILKDEDAAFTVTNDIFLHIFNFQQPFITSERLDQELLEVSTLMISNKLTDSAMAKYKILQT